MIINSSQCQGEHPLGTQRTERCRRVCYWGLLEKLQKFITYHLSIVAVVTWLEYCRYGVKHKENQSINRSIDIIDKTKENEQLKKKHKMTDESPAYCTVSISDIVFEI